MRLCGKKLIERAVSVSLAFAVASAGLVIAPKEAGAENPIIQTTYTADPSPLVVGDTLYVYTTRDELKEQAYDDWSYMNEWRCYSTKDMVNWTDMGQIAHAETFDKEKSNDENWRAWAQQVVAMPVKQEDGSWVTKYYLFAPFNGTKIDVAVSDNPWGPFEDATPNKYLIDGGWGGGNIDPTVYIEDHGNPQDYENYDVYLYWGNPYIRYCKLTITNDLIDVDADTDGDGILSDEESKIDPRFSKDDNKILGVVKPGLHSWQIFDDEGYKSFGVPSQGKDVIDTSESGEGKHKFPTEPEGTLKKRSAFEEGPWVFKHDDGNPATDDYFMFFVGGRIPGETVEYSTAPTPIGPWTYRALLMEREGFSCIHPGVAEFKGHNYLFYLNQMLVGGDGSNRSVCVKEFSYDKNNLVVRETDEETNAYMVQGIEDRTQGKPFFSVNPVGTLNPYELNQAETICWESNLNGPAGGFNGTGAGVKTKAKMQCKDIDEVTNKEAFWKSAALYGVVVTDIDNDDFIKVREVDFGNEGPIKFTVSAACGEGTEVENPVLDKDKKEKFNPEATTSGGTIEIWVDYDSDDKKMIGSVQITNTGGTNEYREFSIDITEKVTGVHDMHFIFRGDEDVKLFNLDTWQFETKQVQPQPDNTQSSQQTGQQQTQQQGTGSDAVTATPVPVQPEKNVKVKTPVIKSAKAGARKVKLTYGRVKGASGYVVYMSKSKKGKFSKKAVVKSGKTTNVTIKKLKKGRTYYFKMKAYSLVNGKKVYSKYSKVKKAAL